MSALDFWRKPITGYSGLSSRVLWPPCCADLLFAIDYKCDGEGRVRRFIPPPRSDVVARQHQLSSPARPATYVEPHWHDIYTPWIGSFA